MADNEHLRIDRGVGRSDSAAAAMPSAAAAAAVFNTAENPKTLIGKTKPSLVSVIPTASFLHLGQVMQLGANKYGPFNWRVKPVPADVYVDAAMRHLLSWFDGEDIDPESGMSHLGHMMACGAILIDAMENGMLKDNRPVKGRTAEMIANFQKTGKFNDE